MEHRAHLIRKLFDLLPINVILVVLAYGQRLVPVLLDRRHGSLRTLLNESRLVPVRIRLGQNGDEKSDGRDTGDGPDDDCAASATGLARTATLPEELSSKVQTYRKRAQQESQVRRRHSLNSQ